MPWIYPVQGPPTGRYDSRPRFRKKRNPRLLACCWKGDSAKCRVWRAGRERGGITRQIDDLPVGFVIRTDAVTNVPLRLPGTNTLYWSAPVLSLRISWPGTFHFIGGALQLASRQRIRSTARSAAMPGRVRPPTRRDWSRHPVHAAARRRVRWCERAALRLLFRVSNNLCLSSSNILCFLRG